MNQRQKKNHLNAARASGYIGAIPALDRRQGVKDIRRAAQGIQRFADLAIAAANAFRNMVTISQAMFERANVQVLH